MINGYGKATIFTSTSQNNYTKRNNPGANKQYQSIRLVSYTANNVLTILWFFSYLLLKHLTCFAFLLRVSLTTHFICCVVFIEDFSLCKITPCNTVFI